MFFINLKQKIIDKQTALCVGIDPHIEYVPSFVKDILINKGSYDFLLCFSKTLIDASITQVSAVKFQSSLFEAFGAEGILALRDSVKYAKSQGLICILDIKRCDIGSSLNGYGRFSFEYIDADAITLIPFMGIKPVGTLTAWLQKSKGVYFVLLSSNVDEAYLIQKQVSNILIKGIDDFLNLNLLRDCVGLVVGAQALDLLDKGLISDIIKFPLLIPGIGFQKANLNIKIKNIIKNNIKNLVSISRSILIGSGTSLNQIHQFNSFLIWQNFLVDNILKFKNIF